MQYVFVMNSEERKRKFTVEKADFQELKDTMDGAKLVLAIDRKPIAEWFKEQFEKLRWNNTDLFSSRGKVGEFKINNQL